MKMNVFFVFFNIFLPFLFVYENIYPIFATKLLMGNTKDALYAGQT